MEETQIFEFDKVQTASPKIAEAYIYLKQLDAATEVSQGDDLERLTSKLGAVFGLAARIKACLCDYLGLEYAEEAVPGTLASEIFSILSSVSDEAFIKDASGTLSAAELKDRLHASDILASRLPFMIAGLDAGEDLSENRNM